MLREPKIMKAFLKLCRVLLGFLVVLVVLAHGSPNRGRGADLLGNMPEKCKNTPPVKSSYEPKGSRIKVSDFEVYETGNSKNLLIAVYDIFGLHPNILQAADLMATEGGFKIVIPDFFKGVYFPMEPYPPNMNDLGKFVQTTGGWETGIKTVALEVIEHYKKQAFDNVGVYGMCWGGKAGIQFSKEFDGVKAVASVHGFNLTTNDVEMLKAPLFIVATNGDPDMMNVYEASKAKFGDKSKHKRFTDVDHGVFASRGDWNNPVDLKRIMEIKSDLIEYFKANFN